MPKPTTDKALLDRVAALQSKAAAAQADRDAAQRATDVRATTVQQARVSFGDVVLYERDNPSQRVRGKVMKHPPSWTADGLGGWASIPLVSGRPVSEFTEPDARRFSVYVLLDRARSMSSVDEDCLRLEGWGATPTVVRIAGTMPPDVPGRDFHFEQDSITPDTEAPNGVWYPAKGLRVRQGYELVLSEHHPDRLVIDRPAALKRVQAAKKAKGR